MANFAGHKKTPPTCDGVTINDGKAAALKLRP